MIKILILFCLLFPSISEATTCRKDYGGTSSCVANDTPAGDCVTLGYSKTDVSGCTNYLYCPFDTSYKKCVAGGKEIDCEDLGYTSDYKDDWCSNVIYCPTDDSYTACVETYDCEYAGFVPDEMNANGEYMWEWCSNTIYCPTDSYYIACADTTPSVSVDCYSVGFNDIDKSDWCDELVYCPTNASLTLCANSCDAYTLSTCPTYGNCSTCSSNGSTKYKIDGCSSGHCLLNNSCYNTVCSYADYPVSATPYGGKAKGSSCYGYRTAGINCSGNQARYYTDIDCNYGYEKVNKYCKKTEYACEIEYYSCTEDCDMSYGWDSSFYWELRECNEECSNSSCGCYRDVYCDDCYSNNENCNLCEQYENNCYY